MLKLKCGVEAGDLETLSGGMEGIVWAAPPHAEALQDHLSLVMFRKWFYNFRDERHNTESEG